MPTNSDDYNLTHYQVLEIEKNASEKEITRAYRQLALKYHSDKQTQLTNLQEYEEKFKEVKKICKTYQTLSDEEKLKKIKEICKEKFETIQKAYTILSDSEKRKEYDQLISKTQQGDFNKSKTHFPKTKHSADEKPNQSTPTSQEFSPFRQANRTKPYQPQHFHHSIYVDQGLPHHNPKKQTQHGTNDQPSCSKTNSNNSGIPNHGATSTQTFDNQKTSTWLPQSQNFHFANDISKKTHAKKNFTQQQTPNHTEKFSLTNDYNNSEDNSKMPQNTQADNQLKKEIQSLNNLIGQLSQQNTALQQQICELKEKNKKLTIKLNDTKEINRFLKIDKNDLQTKLTDSTKQIESLAQELKKFNHVKQNLQPDNIINPKLQKKNIQKQKKTFKFLAIKALICAITASAILMSLSLTNTIDVKYDKVTFSIEGMLIMAAAICTIFLIVCKEAPSKKIDEITINNASTMSRAILL